MKSSSINLGSKISLGRVALVGVVASLAALSAHAGPGVQYWQNLGRIKTTQQAADLKDDCCAVMVCEKCKDVAMYRSPTGGEQHRLGSSPIAVGTQHSCESCGGNVTMEKGKDGMLAGNCSKCGAESAFCAATEKM